MEASEPSRLGPAVPPLPKPGRVRSIWLQARTFVFFLVCFAAFRSAVADWNDVPTGSMLPTILMGDRIFVNKLAYDLKVPFTTIHLATWGNPNRGDVVVFFSPRDGDRLVKRVIGVPGDTLELRDDRLWVNGKPANYSPAPAVAPSALGRQGEMRHRIATEKEPFSTHVHAMMVTPALPARRDFGPLTLGPGQYFMMGDNRDNSFDSRYFGPVNRQAIVGRATAVVLSFDLDHHGRPRWGRFFTGMP